VKYFNAGAPAHLMHAPSIVACLGRAPDVHSNGKHALVSRELCETDERVHICSEVSVFTTRKQVASAWTEVLDAGHRKALCRIAIYEWVKNRVAIRLARNSKGTSVAT
jgi:hypothetical protein